MNPEVRRNKSRVIRKGKKRRQLVLLYLQFRKFVTQSNIPLNFHVIFRTRNFLQSSERESILWNEVRGCNEGKGGIYCTTYLNTC